MNLERKDMSELDKYMKTRADTDTLTVKFGDLRAYISKHYILREDVNTIIKASESVNAQYHGRDDCKSCGLAEALKSKLNIGEK